MFEQCWGQAMLGSGTHIGTNIREPVRLHVVLPTGTRPFAACAKSKAGQTAEQVSVPDHRIDSHGLRMVTPRG